MVLIKSKGFKILLIVIVISSLFLIYWKQSSTNSQRLTYKSLLQYPVISDCQPGKNINVYKYKKDTDSILEEANLLRQFKLKEGYSFGIFRPQIVGIPSGGFCSDFFFLGIKNDKTKERLEGEDQLKAFVLKDLKDEELSIIGQLLYGEIDNKISYKIIYDGWAYQKPCDSYSRIMCVYYKSEFPSSVINGQIVQDEKELKTLHRLILEGLSNRAIIHKKIIVDTEGSAHIESQTIIDYHTGIKL